MVAADQGIGDLLRSADPWQPIDWTERDAYARAAARVADLMATTPVALLYRDAGDLAR